MAAAIRPNIGDFAFYANNEEAVITSAYGRLFLVDVEAMRIMDEVTLARQEPGPFESTRAGREQGSDLARLLSLGNNRFLSVHREFDRHPDESRDHLLVWSIPE